MLLYGSYMSSVGLKWRCLLFCIFYLVLIWFYIFVSCIGFSSSSSSSFFQIEFLMQWHFLLSNCEIVVRFISLITFSFNFDGYFPCCGEATSYPLGFWFWSCISDWKCVLCNVCFSTRIYICFLKCFLRGQQHHFKFFLPSFECEPWRVFWTVIDGRYWIVGKNVLNNSQDIVVTWGITT
jgi:hypothetical protein